jgi:predicted AlkP superfamily pyrophosphatase or phosphodiesterase
LQQQPGVEKVLTRDIVEKAVAPVGKPPTELSLAERLNESYDRDRSPDIFVEFKKNTTLGWPRGAADYVAGHGSPWDYDRQVPILFWWPEAPSLKPQSTAETVDIAPTLASTIGIVPPPIDGHCIRSVANCTLDPAVTSVSVASPGNGLTGY